MYEKHWRKGAIFSKAAGHWWATLLKKAILFFNIFSSTFTLVSPSIENWSKVKITKDEASPFSVSI